MTKIVGSILILIAIYLFLNNFTGTVKIIDSIAGNSVKGIKALQGRN